MDGDFVQIKEPYSSLSGILRNEFEIIKEMKQKETSCFTHSTKGYHYVIETTCTEEQIRLEEEEKKCMVDPKGCQGACTLLSVKNGGKCPMD